MSTVDNNDNNNNDNNNNDNYKKNGRAQLANDFLNKHIGIRDYNVKFIENTKTVIWTNDEGKQLTINEFFTFLDLFYSKKNDETIIFMNMFNNCEIGNCEISTPMHDISYSMEAIKGIWFSYVRITTDETLKLTEEIDDDFTKFCEKIFCTSCRKNDVGDIKTVTIDFSRYSRNINELVKIYKKFYNMDIKNYIEKKYGVVVVRIQEAYRRGPLYAYTEQGILEGFQQSIKGVLDRYDDVSPQILLKMKEYTDSLINDKINKQNKLKFTKIIKDMSKHVQDFKEKNTYSEEEIQNVCWRYKSIIPVGIITCRSDFNEMFKKDFNISNNALGKLYEKHLKILNHILYNMDSDNRDALLISLNIILSQ